MLVSDRDSVFLNDVWEHLLRLSGTKLQFTTAYHPQSDGQTEVRNRGLEQYLKVFVADRPTKWANFLPWAELALNCYHHDGLGTSPFMALYGWEPPSLVTAAPSASCPPAVADIIRQRGELLVWLRKNLDKAQQSMRATANRHRRDVNFEVGDKVLLKLQLYRQHSVARSLSQKLARRFYGPFEVKEHIGPVAYRLTLPEGSRIHDVFHVSLLRPFVDGGVSASELFPSTFARGCVVSRPNKLSDRRRVWRGGVAVDEGLVHWDDEEGRSPSWEPMDVISRRFPSLLLEDKEHSKEGGVDTSIVSSGENNDASLGCQEQEPITYETSGEVEKERAEEERASRPQQRIRGPKKYADFIPYS